MSECHVKRCFFALPLDDTIRAEMADLIASIEIEGLRLLDPESMHVTLKFLGHVEDPRLPQVIAAGRQAVQTIKPIELHTRTIACLPDDRHPRVLALLLNGSKNLYWLAERLDDALCEIGFPREKDLLMAHITIGRFNRDFAKHRSENIGRAMPKPPQTGFTADRMSLMESNLEPQGAFYVPLADFSLIGG